MNQVENAYCIIFFFSLNSWSDFVERSNKQIGVMVGEGDWADRVRFSGHWADYA